MSDELTLTDVMARLDKQAKAIKALRERVRALEAGELRPVATGGTGSAGVPSSLTLVPLPPTCMMCKQPKEDGRRTRMTCKACSIRRTAGIQQGGQAREDVIVGECGTCGKDTGRSTQLVCGTCRPGVQAWQAAVKAGRA